MYNLSLTERCLCLLAADASKLRCIAQRLSGLFAVAELACLLAYNLAPPEVLEQSLGRVEVRHVLQAIEYAALSASVKDLIYHTPGSSTRTGGRSCSEPPDSQECVKDLSNKLLKKVCSTQGLRVPHTVLNTVCKHYVHTKKITGTELPNARAMFRDGIVKGAGTLWRLEEEQVQKRGALKGPWHVHKLLVDVNDAQVGL